MKKKKHMLIALGVLGVLCIVYGVLTLTGYKDSTAEKQEEAIAVNDRRDISSIQIKPSGGQGFTLRVDKSTEGKRNLRIEGYQEAFAFDFSALTKLVGSLERLKAYEMMEGEAEKYGIIEESPKAVICFEDRTTLTLCFGNETPVKGRTYAEVEETGKIYVIRSDIADICSSPVYAFRKPQLFGDFLKQKGNMYVTHLEIYQGSGNFIVIRPQTAVEINNSNSDAPSFYVMERPVFWECSDGKIDALILTPALALEEKALVVKDFPEDLAAYGFTENSAYIQFTVQDSVCKLIFGGETEDGYVYAMRRDMPSVVKIPMASLTMMDLEWHDLINTSLWMRSIDKLRSFTISTPDEVYEMELVRDINGKINGGLLNGAAVKEKDVRDIYMKLLSIHIEGKSSSDKIAGKPEYVITLHRLDGENEPVEFIPADARTYTIVKDGQPLGFYTGINGIQELCESIAALE